MSKSKQELLGVKVGNAVKQMSDASNAEQIAKNVEAGSIEQVVRQTPEPSLNVGKNKARGSVAVIGLVLVVLAFLIAKYLTA